MALEKLVCKTCGNVFEGNYCNNCGEKVIREEDRRLKTFAGEFVNAITFADNKLWKTLRLMIVSPGRYASLYCEGRRKKLMKPISLFFLANLLYFLLPVFNTFTTNLDIQRIAFSYSDFVTEIVDREVASRDIPYVEYREAYDKKTKELSKLFLIVMAMILSVFSSLIHLGGKRKLLADHFTISLELMSYIILFCITGMAILLSAFSVIGFNILSDLTLSASSGILILYFAGRSGYTFFGLRRVRLIVSTILSLVAVIIALWIYRFFLFWITFLVI